MIRRGFWLIVGAAGGIVGYRRVSSVSRQVAQSLGAGPKSLKTPAARKRHWVRETIRFTRDVREGMDQYSDRHRGGQEPTLGASTSASGTAGNRTTGNRTTGNRTTGKRALNSTGHDKREDH
jgi:hypothetical protein